MTTNDGAELTALEPLYSDTELIQIGRGIKNRPVRWGAYANLFVLRDKYEAELATLLARIAELEAKLIAVSRELVSTDNADRYYRGFNEGYDLAETRAAELSQRDEWQPVPDWSGLAGFIPDDAGSDALMKTEFDGRAIWIFDGRQEQTWEEMPFRLPEGYALCRRAATPLGTAAQKGGGF